MALKAEIDELLGELRDDPEALEAEAFEEVRAMLATLGQPADEWEAAYPPHGTTTEIG